MLFDGNGRREADELIEGFMLINHFASRTEPDRLQVAFAAFLIENIEGKR